LAGKPSPLSVDRPTKRSPCGDGTKQDSRVSYGSGPPSRRGSGQRTPSSDIHFEGASDQGTAIGLAQFFPDRKKWIDAMYGFGLAERRFGHFLHNKKREDYLLSSKVGKLFKASKNNQHAEIYPLSDSPNDIVFDYTADGVRRSIEDNNAAFSRHSLGTMLLCTGCR
jgi:hypothetical protein